MRACYIRLSRHARAEADSLRHLREAEERIHADLKRWAEHVNHKLSDEVMERVVVEEFHHRAERGKEYEKQIINAEGGGPAPRGPANDHPEEQPADNPDVTTADNPDGPATAALVPPTPPGTPPGCSAAAARDQPTGQLMSFPPGALVDPGVPQMEEALQPVFPGRDVETMFREHEREAYACQESFVIAAQRVSCLMALHNEVGFEGLRETLCRDDEAFESKATNGSGETTLEFMELPLMLLIRIGVSSMSSDAHIDDNCVDHPVDDYLFGPFVGSSD